jgi:hypothetical protein
MNAEQSLVVRCVSRARNMAICGHLVDRRVRVRNHFDALNVRYLWRLVRPQYTPHESRPTLHNPLGLSQGLKSRSTSPQNGTKAAAIAMLFNSKMGIMRQSGSRRTRYTFYERKMSDIECPQNARKISQHAQF